MNTNFKEAFDVVYNELNAEQKQAVDCLSGEVMVIAGPGTGKTQILSARIGKLLLETDTEPQNILCLTYTDAGVIAMRNRLKKFIGADAYKLNIYTFHAFCNTIIQENLGLFEKTSLDPVSELEKIAYAKELIDNLPKGNPLKRYRGDVYYDVNNLLHLFAAMKREAWKEDFLIQAIENYKQEISNDKTNKEFYYIRKGKNNEIGDAKASLKEALQNLDKLKAAVQQFEIYQNLLKKNNRYDFDDMINWVIDAFSNNAHLLQLYQEKLRHILVDEYQDTSNTQNKIVELLYNTNYSESLFVVGDDDQSIYRFQGANIENLENFYASYASTIQTIVLTKNYRSTQIILDASKVVIENNQERLVNKISGLSKNLMSSNVNLQLAKNPPIVSVCNTMHEEMIYLVQQIEALLAKGILPNQIAIIYRENKYGDALATYLKLKQINYYSKRDVSLLTLPLAKQILTILHFINAELNVVFSGDEWLFKLLHFDCFGIKPIEIAKLAVEVAKTQYSDDNKTSLREVIHKKANTATANLFSASICSKELNNASNVLENLITQASSETLQSLFHAVIQQTGLLHKALQSPEKHWLLLQLQAFVGFIEEETRRNPNLSLQDLLSVFQLMEDEKIILPVKEISGSNLGVNLLTAHGSKGLEFQYVFIAGCTAQFWEKKKAGNVGFKLPPTVFTTNATTDAIEELRRLFYVAITRAQLNVTITYANTKDDGKALEPSQFITELEALGNVKTEAINLSVEETDAYLELKLSAASKPKIEELEEAFIAPILEKFTMNVTALNNYLTCPLLFYYNNLIKVPTGVNENSQFGSAMHNALETFFKNMLNNNKQFPSVQSLVGYFNYQMNRLREHFTNEQFSRRLEYGQEILTNYYNKYIHQFKTIITAERMISNVVINGIPIKGKVDKLEFDGNNVNVVDYKTGDPEKAISKNKYFDAPNDKNPLGGNYWRQAVFYKILIDNYTQKNWKVISTEFDFLEPNKQNQFVKQTVVIQPQDITTVTQQLTTVWEKIQNREFYVGCGKEDCKWCNFTKQNKLAVQLIEDDDHDEYN